MQEAKAISIVSKRGELVVIELLGADGKAIAVARLRPHVFERIWDKIGDAVSVMHVAGLAPSRETFELSEAEDVGSEV